MTKRRNLIVHIATSAEDLPSVERFEDGRSAALPCSQAFSLTLHLREMRRSCWR